MITPKRMIRFLFCPGDSWPEPLGEDGPLGVSGLGGVTSSCYAPERAVDASPQGPVPGAKGDGRCVAACPAAGGGARWGTAGPGAPGQGAIGIVGE